MASRKTQTRWRRSGYITRSSAPEPPTAPSAEQRAAQRRPLHVTREMRLQLPARAGRRHQNQRREHDRAAAGGVPQGDEATEGHAANDGALDTPAASSTSSRYCDERIQVAVRRSLPRRQVRRAASRRSHATPARARRRPAASIPIAPEFLESAPAESRSHIDIHQFLNVLPVFSVYWMRSSVLRSPHRLRNASRSRSSS